MAADTDLYATLGVAKTATEDEIRKSYRKLAREHHPDVNPGKPEAEEKFKAVAAAYDVLSNKEKRALYDEFGRQGLRGGFDPEQARAYRRYADGSQTSRQAGGGGGGVPFDFDLGELLNQARGRQSGARQAPFPIDGEDLLATVELDLASALRGTEVELRVPSRSTCEVCAGSGERPGSEAKTCPTCEGSGRSQVVRGPMRMMITCPTCSGTGKVHEPCEHCHGEGTLGSEQTLRVRIPAGADEGSELRVRGKGLPGLFGGAPGDVVIRTHLKPHPYFERTGLDLKLKLPIRLSEAHQGGSISVPTPTGPVQMKLPPRTQQGAQLRLKGKGVARGAERGDLYVVMDVRLPDSDDPALTEQLAAIDSFYSQDLRAGVEL
ncbi:MAG: DnaJ-class molecular chaperone with C-terminal Zn finger domain [Myxococcaceae bacterium]|nr:DnaJ-class molecular chaperone with C-terminal Zn finger domain [Myxococcaceae bacterium]